MAVFGVPIITKYGKVYPTHLQKKDLVSYYISTPGWFIQKRLAIKYTYQLGQLKIKIKINKYQLWLSTYSRKRSCFSLLPSSRSHCCHIPCCIPRCMQGLSGDCTSLPLSFWSWIGLVISGEWRCSCGHIISRAWLCIAYNWAVCMTILGCLQE